LIASNASTHSSLCEDGGGSGRNWSTLWRTKRRTLPTHGTCGGANGGVNRHTPAPGVCVGKGVLTPIGVMRPSDAFDGRPQARATSHWKYGPRGNMHAELATAVARVLDRVEWRDPFSPNDDEVDRLLQAANLVTLGRTGVDYDYKGNVIDAHAPEMPTRFAKQLTQMMRGAVAIGMDRDCALRLALRCARDSMPPLRLAILEDVARHPDARASDVRQRLEKPWSTVDRQLQSLHMLGVLACDEERVGQRSIWRYRIAEGVDPTVLIVPPSPDLLPTTGNGEEEKGTVTLSTNISGEVSHGGLVL
jgi:hypothetical protein